MISFRFNLLPKAVEIIKDPAAHVTVYTTLSPKSIYIWKFIRQDAQGNTKVIVRQFEGGYKAFF